MTAGPVMALTARQREVLMWAARGKDIVATAGLMGVSAATVRVHRGCAARALGAENCLHAVVRALSGGIFTLEEVS